MDRKKPVQPRLYIRDFLASEWAGLDFGPPTQSEYRFFSSGVLFNGRVLTADPMKSTAARVVLNSPAWMFVCSDRMETFPQEIAVRFACPDVTEKSGAGSIGFKPDDEIARDLAALVTLLLRRLISVGVKVSSDMPKGAGGGLEHLEKYPIPIGPHFQAVTWAKQPVSVEFGLEGVKQIVDPNPMWLPVDDLDVERLLLALPRLAHWEEIVLAARLYAQALEQIVGRPDLAYASLISCAETVAGVALEDYKPTTAEMVQSRRSVQALALSFGLSGPQAEQLAVKACDAERWSGRRFRRFLSDYGKSSLSGRDDLFPLDTNLQPAIEDFDEVIKRVYEMRGRSTHAGRPYPATVGIGQSPAMDIQALGQILQGERFPPAVWFERVVGGAVRAFWRQSVTPESQAPPAKE